MKKESNLSAVRLLLVEDDVHMQEVLYDYFQANGFHLECAADGKAARSMLAQKPISMEESFDLILLDVMMPGLDGFGLCQSIRRESDVPIIFLTARGDEDDKLYGYELGADDYVTKPFSMAVLLAKVQSLLKRAKGQVLDSRIIVGDVLLSANDRRVSVRGMHTNLAPKEYDLLRYLIENQGKTLPRERLLLRIWGYDFERNDRVLDTHIKKLRKALGPCASYIHTVVKVGYRFEVVKYSKENNESEVSGNDT